MRSFSNASGTFIFFTKGFQWLIVIIPSFWLAFVIVLQPLIEMSSETKRI